MATIRQHLQKMHQKAADDQRGLAESHKMLVKCYSGLSKSLPAGSDDHYTPIIAEHATMAKIHGDAADAHAGFASDCEKSHESEMNKIIPDSISSVASQDSPFGINARPVPRPGAPTQSELSKSAVDRIDPRFRHLIQTGEEV